MRRIPKGRGVVWCGVLWCVLGVSQAPVVRATLRALTSRRLPSVWDLQPQRYFKLGYQWLGLKIGTYL